MRTIPLAALAVLASAGCKKTTVQPDVPFEAMASVSAWCSLSPSPCLDGLSAASFSLIIAGVDARVVSDGTLTLTVSGDLDDPVRETLAVMAELVDLGVIVNNDPDDDSFDHPTDVGVDCEPITMSAVVSESALIQLVSDGQLELTFTPPGSDSDIDLPGCADADELITATISYMVPGS